MGSHLFSSCTTFSTKRCEKICIIIVLASRPEFKGQEEDTGFVYIGVGLFMTLITMATTVGIYHVITEH